MIEDLDTVWCMCVKGGMNHASSCVCVCVWVWVHRYAACLINVCVSHKLQSQWLDWCNDSSNGKYSSGDCRRPKTINVCIRFIKWNPCTKRLHLVLFHHSVLKLGEVLSKHMLIENHWTLIYLSNKSFYPPSVSFRHHSNAGNKQQKKSCSNFVPNRAKSS